MAPNDSILERLSATSLERAQHLDYFDVEA